MIPRGRLRRSTTITTESKEKRHARDVNNSKAHNWDKNIQQIVTEHKDLLDKMGIYLDMHFQIEDDWETTLKITKILDNALNHIKKLEKCAMNLKGHKCINQDILNASKKKQQAIYTNITEIKTLLKNIKEVVLSMNTENTPEREKIEQLTNTLNQLLESTKLKVPEGSIMQIEHIAQSSILAFCPPMGKEERKRSFDSDGEVDLQPSKKSRGGM